MAILRAGQVTYLLDEERTLALPPWWSGVQPVVPRDGVQPSVSEGSMSLTLELSPSALAVVSWFVT